MSRHRHSGNDSNGATALLDEESHQASSQFADKASELRSVIQEIVALVPEAASEQLGSLKEKAMELCSFTGEKASDFGRKAVAAVKEHPARSALIGVGAAAIAWWMFSRRSA